MITQEQGRAEGKSLRRKAQGPPSTITILRIMGPPLESISASYT